MKMIFYQLANDCGKGGFVVLAIILFSVGNALGQNTLYGEFAGAGITSGIINTFVGNTAGGPNSEGFGNSFFGYNAGLRSTGNTNSFLV